MGQNSPVAKKIRGYTLIEIVTALAAFTIIMLAITYIFSRSYTFYREVKKTQINLQTAQSTLNLLAKELRTSSVVANGATGENPYTLRFFDYSQSRCIQYVFDQTTEIITRQAENPPFEPTASNPGDEQVVHCTGYTFPGTSQVLLTGLKGQTIRVVNSDNDTTNPVVGRVTISLSFGTGSNETTIQTSVSLRDFNYTGL